jgi:hypothetical protein
MAHNMVCLLDQLITQKNFSKFDWRRRSLRFLVLEIYLIPTGRNNRQITLFWSCKDEFWPDPGLSFLQDESYMYNDLFFSDRFVFGDLFLD